MKRRRDARLPVATFALAVKEELCGVRLAAARRARPGIGPGRTRAPSGDGPVRRAGPPAPGMAAAVAAELHGLIRGAGTLVVSGTTPSGTARRPAAGNGGSGLGRAALEAARVGRAAGADAGGEARARPSPGARPGEPPMPAAAVAQAEIVAPGRAVAAVSPGAALPLGVADPTVATGGARAAGPVRALAAPWAAGPSGVFAAAAPGLVCEIRADRAVVARRAYRLFRAATGMRPVLAVRRGPGPAGGRFVCRLSPAAPALGDLGLLDAAGRPLARIPPALLRPGRAPALLRGFFLGAGSVDDPARDHHLEFVVAEDGPGIAEDLQAALASLGCPARRTRRRGRIVLYLKDGGAIAVLLGALGAAQAMLRYEEQRVRSDVRGRVNRLVNAETANIGKAAAAGLRQREDVLALAAAGALERLPADLQAVARARLGHPEASLREIGALCDPPLGKSAVQRRMAALRRMVRSLRSGSPGAPSPSRLPSPRASPLGTRAGGALHCAGR